MASGTRHRHLRENFSAGFLPLFHRLYITLTVFPSFYLFLASYDHPLSSRNKSKWKVPRLYREFLQGVREVCTKKSTTSNFSTKKKVLFLINNEFYLSCFLPLMLLYFSLLFSSFLKISSSRRTCASEFQHSSDTIFYFTRVLQLIPL